MNNPDKYKVREDGFIYDTENNVTIPNERSNSYYREYLDWAKNNTVKDFEDLTELKLSYISKINEECSRLRLQLISDLSTTLEYFMLLQDVNIYKNNNYSGDVPRSILFYSQLYNKTPTEVCNIYLQKYNKVYNSVMSYREIRLSFIKDIKLVTTKAELKNLFNSKMNEFDTLLKLIKGVNPDDS